MTSFSAWVVRLFFIYVRRTKAIFSSIERTRENMAQLYLQPESFYPPKKLIGVTVKRIDSTDWPLYHISSSNASGKVQRDAMLYIHGGAWYREISPPHWQLAAQLVRETGLDVVVPIYPLLPRPAATAVQVQEGLVSIIRQLGQNIVCIAGDSAGGNISLVLGQQLQLHHTDLTARVRCIVLISPCGDCSGTHPGIPDFEKRDPWLSAQVLHVAGPLWAGGLDIRDPVVSPLFGEVNNLPPVMMLVGTDDIICLDTRRLSAKYQGKEIADGIPGSYTSDKLTYVEKPDMIHVYPLLPHTEGAEGRELIVRFILKHIQ